MSNLWQPFTDARRWHVAKVFDQQADSSDMTSLAASRAQAWTRLFCGSCMASVVADCNKRLC
jgi:hypothetical protein